ncbi:unnamed protein product [Rhizoctonia solani]|nr:unnamed protein product [Rhizoctonia solani]
MSALDKTRRRGSVLSVLRRNDKTRAKVARQSIDDHEQLREAAARSTGLHSILPDLDDDDEHNTLKRRPAGIDLRKLARDETEAKLCGQRPMPLPTVPVFPCAQSALAAHTQLSGPLLKHQTPTTLARLVGSKAWKSRHGVFCTYALRNCSCAQPHRASTHSCDSATRTLACLHLFASSAPDALELARLIVTEDSVVFVVEPTLAPDDSRRGPRDLDGRKGVFQVQGISGAPQPTSDRSRRRDSIGANTVKSGFSHRPHTVASLALPSSSSSNLVLGLDDDSRVHAMWFLQCPDPDSRQQWVSCIKRAVLLQRAERAGFGGTIHFTSPRSVTDPVPSGDLDVVLAMRAQAHRGSSVPYASPPVTPMTSTFAPSAHFAPSNAFVTSPVSPLSPASDLSHADAISLAFTRSQTPNYAPSVRTTHTAPVSHSKTRSRSSTVTAPVQALRGFFSRPPSRSASVAATKRVRTSSGSGPTALGSNHLASFTGVHEPTNVYPLGTPISAGLGSIDLSSCATTMDEPIGTPGLGPSTLPGLGPSGLPTPNKPPLVAPISKGPASLPPPPRAKRAGSVSHVLHRGDETVRGREDEEGVRRPSLVPMLSLSFGRGDDLDRGQTPVDEPPPRVLPPMLAPPSSPLPLPPGPGASTSATALGFHPSGSALALPQPPLNIPPTNLPQPKPQHAAGLLPSLSPPMTASAPPHPPTLALRTVGSIPILPGSWPIAAYPHSTSDLTETTPSASAITPSDVYQSFSNDAYGFSPYRASMASDAFRISIHSDAYQAVSPTSEMYLTAHELPSALTSNGGSYMNLVGSSSNVNVHLPVGSTSHLAISSSHLAATSSSHLGTSTSHLDTTSSSHLDLSDATPHASSTPFTTTTTASDSSQASVYSVKLGRNSLDAFRSGMGSDTVRSSDTFRSSSSDVFRSNVSDVFRTNASDVFRSNASDVYRTNASDVFRTNASDVYRSNSSDVFRSNGNGATAHSRVSLAFGRGMLHEHPEADAWEGDCHSGRGSYGSREYAHSGSVRDYAGSARDYTGSARDYAGSTRDYTGSTRDYAGSGKEYSQSAYTQSINVRESPTRTVATGSYRDREGSTRDRDPDSAPSSPSSRAENYAGPTGGLFTYPQRDTFAVRRDTFGVAPKDSYIVPDDAAHPFSSASPSQTPVKSAAPSPARRSHRRAGSYAGPTLYTIASGSFSFDRRQSQRGKPELPPAAPPPSVPLPPTPATSRPSTPLSRPRTPSRQSTKTPPVPPLPAPARSSLRTRLRMLSTPSTPEPVPRELGPPHEEDLAQPISRVPIQLLVMEDSIQRAASEHDTSREVHGGLGIGLPPPPRTRPMPIRQHSYSASVSASDREGSSEGRRSDESGKRFGGARDSAVHLEHRD